MTGRKPIDETIGDPQRFDAREGASSDPSRAALRSPVSAATLSAIIALSAFGVERNALGQCSASAYSTLDARHPVTVTGVIRRGRGTHPARGRFTYYFIQLPRPVCVANVDNIQSGQIEDMDDVDRFQLMTASRPRVGRTVTITGVVSVAVSAWHEELLLLGY
jgi:hypothetical protein